MAKDAMLVGLKLYEVLTGDGASGITQTQWIEVMC